MVGSVESGQEEGKRCMNKYSPAINIRSWSFSAETLKSAIPRARPCIVGGGSVVVDAIAETISGISSEATSAMQG